MKIKQICRTRVGSQEADAEYRQNPMVGQIQTSHFLWQWRESISSRLRWIISV